MSIKKQYRLYSTIAIFISIIASIYIMLELKEKIDTNSVYIFLGAFSFCTHLLFVIINFKKEKQFDKELGFIKVNGDSWLGYDGNWHDGFRDIYKRKVEQYYEKGGEDFGYSSSLYMNVINIVIGCIGGLATMVGKLEGFNSSEPFLIFLISALLLYAIIRRAILG